MKDVPLKVLETVCIKGKEKIFRAKYHKGKGETILL